MSDTHSPASQTAIVRRYAQNPSLASRPESGANPLVPVAEGRLITGFASPPSHSIPRPLEQNPNFLRDSYEMNLFEHWLSLMSNIIYLDGGAPPTRNLLAQQIEMAQEPQSLCLPMLLASASTHRFAMGIGGQEDLLRLKQRAILSLRQGLVPQSSTGASTSPKRAAQSTSREQMVHTAPIALSDHGILASLSLAGSEVILGSPLTTFLPLLQGSVNLVKQRQVYNRCQCSCQHPMQQDRLFKIDSLVVATTIDTLFYFDTMACVPCARRPISRVLLIHSRNLQDKRQRMATMKDHPNRTLGFGADIFFIIGEATTLVADLYEEKIDLQDFDRARNSVLQELKGSILELSSVWITPTEIPTTDGSTQRGGSIPSPNRLAAGQVENHNANVAAALSHAYATQIFLLRSTNFQKDSQDISRLASCLAASIAKVPRDSAPMSIMIWPLWALGCESYPERKAENLAEAGIVENQRQASAKLFSNLFERMHMINIQVAFEALVRHIWRCNWPLDEAQYASIPSSTAASTPAGKSPSVGSSYVTEMSTPQTPQSIVIHEQSQWVRKCWLENIALCFS